MPDAAATPAPDLPGRSWGGWVGLGLLTFVAAGVGYAFYAGARSDAVQAVELAKLRFVSAADTANSLIPRLERLGGAKAGKQIAKLEADMTTAERAFVEACQQCAAAETCERDRLTVRRGAGSTSYNPCR